MIPAWCAPCSSRTKRSLRSTPANKAWTGAGSPASHNIISPAHFLAMQIPLVMTIISPDRTWLVEAVARAVADHGGNWLESRMCRLGGEFAGILRMEIPASRKSELLAALQKLQTNGLQIVVRDDAPTTATAGRQTKLE